MTSTVTCRFRALFKLIGTPKDIKDNTVNIRQTVGQFLDDQLEAMYTTKINGSQLLISVNIYDSDPKPPQEYVAMLMKGFPHWLKEKSGNCEGIKIQLVHLDITDPVQRLKYLVSPDFNVVEIKEDDETDFLTIRVQRKELIGFSDL